MWAQKARSGHCVPWLLLKHFQGEKFKVHIKHILCVAFIAVFEHFLILAFSAVRADNVSILIPAARKIEFESCK